MAARVELSVVLTTQLVSATPDRNWKKSHQVMGVLSEMVPEAMTEAVMTHIKDDVNSDNIMSLIRPNVRSLAEEIYNNLLGTEFQEKSATIYCTDGIPSFHYQLDVAAKIQEAEIADTDTPLQLPQNEVWHEAFCGNCGIKIQGVRFKCAVCPDFDLCDACELLQSQTYTIHYWDHVFIMLRRPCLPVPNSIINPPTQLNAALFHQISVLICPNCRYMEFGNCTAHLIHFTEPKGDFDAKCAKCENATDTIDAYAICRKCKASPYEKNWFIVHNNQGQKILKAFETSGVEGRFISHLLLHCPGCQIIEFPTTYSGGLCINNDNQLWDPQKDMLFTPEHWRCRHYGDCTYQQSNIITIPVVFHLKEARFMARALRGTPPLFVISEGPTQFAEEAKENKENEQNVVKNTSMVTIPASRLQNERDNILGEHKVEKSRQLSAAEVMRREQEERDKKKRQEEQRAKGNENDGANENLRIEDQIPEYIELMDLIEAVTIELRLRNGTGSANTGTEKEVMEFSVDTCTDIRSGLEGLERDQSAAKIETERDTSLPSNPAFVEPDVMGLNLKVPDGYQKAYDVMLDLCANFRFYFEDFAAPDRKENKNFFLWSDFLKASLYNVSGVLVEDQDIIAEMFNNVPRPLLTFSCFEPEESYNSLQTEEARREFMYDLLQSLPQTSKEVLMELVQTMNFLSTKTEENNIDIEFLSKALVSYVINPADLDYKKAKRQRMKVSLAF